MQYWVFFQGGVGGDGFVNLLDHANNVEPADGLKQWRTIEMPNGKIKFYEPNWVSDTAFIRAPKEQYNPYTVKPTANYLKLILKGINTAIPVHLKSYSEIINNHSFKSIFTKDLHKIFLYSDNTERIYADFKDKNPNSGNEEKYRLVLQQYNSESIKNLFPPMFFDTCIDIEQVWTNWNYLNDILVSIGISLDKSVYEEYLIVSKRP